ncbi:glycoside hydrolase family 32 protein [Chitinophaga cymbidii]|uniref:glycoside hydrolase family 32 protein n=1 Tax=Chitinophaga cymbidii TaxID=1096750 RepID=UPI0011BFABEC|nr:glycoside hydrolase family 32 protein [Chitinophaga cymbidii]
MKIIWTGILCLCVLAQTASAQQFSKTFKASQKWLALPVKNGAPKKNVELWIDGENERWFDIELADGEPDWYAYLDISDWKGMDIELRVDKLDAASKAFNPIRQSDEDKNEGVLYKEKLRGQFHFSPKRGWTNDPNGMVYYNGEYHLFFQHNPYGVKWGNMHWGHAVSKDLVHWTELGEALYPDKFGPMFSGGAVVDSNNTSGFGQAGKPPMVMFFTGARSWGQGLAWSTDGRTFSKMDRTVVHRINKDNRDPKVIWHAPTKKWVMVLWVERENGQNSMQFLNSPDLKHWTKTSITMGGRGDDRYLFECPEFFELPVEGRPGEKKWVLTAANSEYAIGTFDGITFTPEAERLQGQRGRDFYAAQTFSDQPQGRRIEIGWWRTHTDKGGNSFNQSQSIPMELKLVPTAEGLRLTRTPVKELEVLREKTYTVKARSLKEGGSNPFADIQEELLEIRTTIEPGKASQVTLDINGLPVVYDVAKQQLQIDGVNAPAPLVNGKLSLIIYADRIGVEVFTADGLLFMPVNVNIDTTKRSLGLSVKGGTAKLGKTTVYGLKSIW